MSNKQYLGLVAVLVVAGAIAFYWYAYRPSQIRERCYAEAEFDQRAISQPDDAKRRDFINGYYADCLKRFGIE